MKLLHKTLFIVIAVLSINCEETTAGSSSDNSDDLESTLNDSSVGNGIEGNIDEYFYNLNQGTTPYVNSQFYRYSGLSIIEPLAFDPTSDTLNFITVSDYVLSFSPDSLINEMITLEPFDETISVTTGGVCVDVDDELDGDTLTVDCPDINGDGLITGGDFSDLYRFEEINFSHPYTDVLKLDWDGDNERYMVISVQGEFSPLSHKYVIGHPDSLYENNHYDEGEEFTDDNSNGEYNLGEDFIDTQTSPDISDSYDSLVYITQINQNDLDGFYFDDEDENGFWNGDEEWDFPDSVSFQYYFDSSQLSSVDSIYISENLNITHNFIFNRMLIGLDSMMFKISTDCNDDGLWTDAESVDVGNGVWDPAEPWLNQGVDPGNPDPDDTIWNSGEPFLDRNCNGQWDDAEPTFFEECTDGTWDDVGAFCDMGNGIIDLAEVCWPEYYTDDNENQEYDEGEDFVDDNENGEWDDYSDGCTEYPDRLYSMSDRPNVLIASYTGDDWVVFEEFYEEDVITPRWPVDELGNPTDTLYLIQSFEQLEIKPPKTTSLVEKVETIYSYQLIENTFEEGKEYSIAKTIWDDGEGRSVGYHLYRKDDLTSDIVELVHDSYFILPTTTPGSSIDGGSFGDYLVFDNLACEQTYLYTHNGLLRDGEVHQTSRIAYSPQTNAEYYIIETYEVISDTIPIPELNNEYDCNNTGSICEEYEDMGNNIWDEGEDFIDCNNTGSICEGDDDWDANLGDGAWNDGEVFTDAGSGEWNEGEPFTDEFTLLTDAFKIIRTKNSIMQGSGLELVEKNNVWLARNYGIVRDEMEFRFNDPDDFDGYYRLELINCRHCDDEGASSRAGMFTGSTEVNFNELQNVDQFNDSYNKIRTFGLQKLESNSQP